MKQKSRQSLPFVHMKTIGVPSVVKKRLLCIMLTIDYCQQQRLLVKIKQKWLK